MHTEQTQSDNKLPKQMHANLATATASPLNGKGLICKLDLLLPSILAVIVWGLLTACQHVANASPLCLQISRFRSDEVLGQWVLNDNHRFALGFIHSVSETPVIDYYQVLAESPKSKDKSKDKDKNKDSENNTHSHTMATTGRILQTGERFEHHGAGLPSHVSEGNDWQHRDGYFWLAMQRNIPQLIVRTDKNYRNQLYIGETFGQALHTAPINLNQWADGALLIAPANCVVDSR